MTISYATNRTDATPFEELHNRVNYYLPADYWSLPLRDKVLIFADRVVARGLNDKARDECLDLLTRIAEVEHVVQCERCGDTGLEWVRTGPDDAEREPCSGCDMWDRIIEATPIAESEEV